MKVVDAAFRKDTHMLEQMSKDAWEENVRGFVNQANESQIDRVRAGLSEACGQEEWKCISFENMVLERQVMNGPKDLYQLEQYHDVLVAYAGQECVLESTAKAAEKIRAYLNTEEQDQLVALKYLKEAVDYCPDFADGIRKFISFYSDFEKQKMQKQKQEMQTLRNQVLAQVRAMVANGQDGEALAILQQLKQMFPNDLDVAMLALEIRIKE